MVFFITLAYIALSIDASGLIRYLAFKVLQKGGKAGHRLYFYLYTFFFALATFIVGHYPEQRTRCLTPDRRHADHGTQLCRETIRSFYPAHRSLHT